MTDTSTNALFIIASASNAPYGRNTLGHSPSGTAAASQPATADGKTDVNSHQYSQSADTSDTPGLPKNIAGASMPSETANGFADLMATVASINQHAPGCRIAVVQYSAYPLTQSQHETLIQHVDYLMDYSGNEQIQAFDRKLASSEAIAAFSELTSLMWFLQLGQHHKLYEPFKRVFKLSPGTQLTAAIKDSAHYAQNAQGRYVFPNAVLAHTASGTMALQFSNTFYSMDPMLIPSFTGTLEVMLRTMQDVHAQGQSVSIECLLYKLIDAGKIFYDLKPAISRAPISQA